MFSLIFAALIFDVDWLSIMQDLMALPLSPECTDCEDGRGQDGICHSCFSTEHLDYKAMHLEIMRFFQKKVSKLSHEMLDILVPEKTL